MQDIIDDGSRPLNALTLRRYKLLKILRRRALRLFSCRVKIVSLCAVYWFFSPSQASNFIV